MPLLWCKFSSIEHSCITNSCSEITPVSKCLMFFVLILLRNLRDAIFSSVRSYKIASFQLTKFFLEINKTYKKKIFNLGISLLNIIEKKIIRDIERNWYYNNQTYKVQMVEMNNVHWMNAWKNGMYMNHVNNCSVWNILHGSNICPFVQ